MYRDVSVLRFYDFPVENVDSGKQDLETASKRIVGSTFSPYLGAGIRKCLLS